MGTKRRNARLRDSVVAVIGVILVAFNMRTAVSGLSPIYDIVDADVPLSLDVRALLGALPPFAFVVGGLLTPRLTRRIGLEWNLVALIGLMIAGHIVRGLATDWTTIVLGSALVLVGSGMGNVSLPPVIKRYFPHNVGPMSSTYITFVSVSSIIPPLIAVPLSHALSWRIALGAWVILAIAAMIPWLLEIHSGRRTADSSSQPVATIALRRSPTAWAIATTLSVSSITGYSMFAWLPTIATETAGLSASGGGIMLALFAGAGLPLALGIPVLASRVRNVASLVYVGAALTVIGALGLGFFPSAAPYLWAFIFGSGPLLFPLALVLINLRTESTQSSLRLSAFAQFFAYVMAGIAAPVMGLSRAVSGGWTIALVGVACTSIAAVWAAGVLARNNTVDAELRA